MNNHADGSANLAAALRRSNVVSTSTAARSPNRVRAEAMSAIQRGVGQPIVGDLAQRLRPGLAAQVSDVGDAELYDGLTPVTMTL